MCFGRPDLVLDEWVTFGCMRVGCVAVGVICVDCVLGGECLLVYVECFTGVVCVARVWVACALAASLLAWF